MTKRIKITATCKADIEEVWTFDVPDDWKADDDMENVEELLAHTPEDCTYVDCVDETVGGEEDRVYIKVEETAYDNAR